MNGEFFGMENIDLPGAMIRAEEEGLTDMVDTRDAKINAIAKELDKLKRRDPYIDTMQYIDDIIEGQGIDIGTLSAKEKNIINRHI